MRLRGLPGAAAIVVALIAASVHAGVVQKDSDGGIVTISDGKMMKTFPTGQKAVFDSKLGLVTAVYPATHTYTTFTRQQFCATASESRYSVKDVSPFSVLDVLPGGFHVRVNDGYRVHETDARPRVIEATLPDKTGPPKPPAIKVVESGAGGTVSGFKTKRFKIYVDGELEDEIWMAMDSRLLDELKELDMAAVLGFFQCEEKVTAAGQGAADNDAYRKLFERGWPLRIKSDGDSTYYRVVSIKVRDVPAEEFGVPRRFDPVPFSRSILGIDRDEE